MLGNLSAAMKVKNISTVAVARLINTTEKTVNNKINETTDFTLKEAQAIKDDLFPEYDFCYLFSSTDKRTV